MVAKRADSAGAQPIGEWPEGPLVQGAPLEPLRYVERLLTRPDGTQVMVLVPVYPPFKLETWPPSPAEARHLGVPKLEAVKTRAAECEDLLELEENAA